MDAMPVLRPATPADAALIAHITRSAWAGRVDPSSSAYRETEAQIAAQLAEGGGFVLHIGTEAAGSARYSPVVDGASGQTIWEIRRMGVLPAWRGKGYALVMMDAIVAHARRQGIFDLRLAVRYDQPRLIEVYAGMGFALAPDLEYAHASPGSVPPTVMRRTLSA
jgi:GNAT superfamily N-acetyltransferase